MLIYTIIISCVFFFFFWFLMDKLICQLSLYTYVFCHYWANRSDPLLLQLIWKIWVNV